jgi:hypothetical protein
VNHSVRDQSSEHHSSGSGTVNQQSGASSD